MRGLTNGDVYEEKEGKKKTYKDFLAHSSFVAEYLITLQYLMIDINSGSSALSACPSPSDIGLTGHLFSASDGSGCSHTLRPISKKKILHSA